MINEHEPVLANEALMPIEPEVIGYGDGQTNDAEENYLDERIAKKINQRLVDMVNNVNHLKDGKRSMTQSYNEQIKENETKAKCLAKAIRGRSLDYLLECYSKEDIKWFMDN